MLYQLTHIDLGIMQIQRSICFGSRQDGISLQPVDVMAGKQWRIGLEHVVVHMSSSAVPVPDNGKFGIQHTPTALIIGNAEMPAGSITNV